MSELQLRNAVKREFTAFIQNWKENGKSKYLEAAREAFNNSRRHKVAPNLRDKVRIGSSS